MATRSTETEEYHPSRVAREAYSAKFTGSNARTTYATNAKAMRRVTIHTHHARAAGNATVCVRFAALASSTEQLGMAYLAVNWEATAEEVSQFLQPHPSLSELFGESVLALTGRSLHG